MKHKTIRIPMEFKKYFWDVDFKRISAKKNLSFILGRIMNFGNTKAVRWMFENVNKQKIIKYLLKSSKQRLDRRSYNFWRIYFGLSDSKQRINPLWPY